jgi:hypothetical protein
MFSMSDLGSLIRVGPDSILSIKRFVGRDPRGGESIQFSVNDRPRNRKSNTGKFTSLEIWTAAGGGESLNPSKFSQQFEDIFELANSVASGVCCGHPERIQRDANLPMSIFS